jgi:hypothetical protein
MNPNYGYQLYQAQRVTSRTEVLARDAQRGRQAAALTRGTRRLAGGARAGRAAHAARALVSRACRRRSPSWA